MIMYGSGFRDLDPVVPEGVRPVSVPLPPPGCYWIKIHHARPHLRNDDDDEDGSVWRWEPAPSEWMLVAVDADGEIAYHGGEEVDWWDSTLQVVVAVSARVEPPA